MRLILAVFLAGCGSGPPPESTFVDVPPSAALSVERDAGALRFFKGLPEFPAPVPDAGPGCGP